MSARADNARTALQRAIDQAAAENETLGQLDAVLCEPTRARLARLKADYERESAALRDELNAAQMRPDFRETQEAFYRARAASEAARHALAVAEGLDVLEAAGFTDGQRVNLWKPEDRWTRPDRFAPRVWGGREWTLQNAPRGYLIQVFKPGDPFPENRERRYGGFNPGAIVVREILKGGGIAKMPEIGPDLVPDLTKKRVLWARVAFALDVDPNAAFPLPQDENPFPEAQS